jgi:hypothetical protein
MIVWGGESTTNTYYNDGARYNPATQQWTVVNTTGAPSARSRHTAVWTGNEMIIWGGYAAGNSAGGIYRPDLNLWQLTTTIGAPSGRYLHSAVCVGNRMLIWGGAYGGDQVWSYGWPQQMVLYQKQ